MCYYSIVDIKLVVMRIHKIGFTLRLTEEELEIINAYVVQTGRTKSDIMREMIRELGKKMKRQDRRKDDAAALSE